jgi:hypothetical protein
MKKLLCLVSFLLAAPLSHADEIDTIVKRSIAKSADCTCPNCTCDNCQCKPSSGQPIKRLQEAYVRPCMVNVNGRVFMIRDMTAPEAMAAIKAQGDSVVFLNSYNEPVAPPVWYAPPVVIKTVPVREVPVVPVREVPVYTRPAIGFGFGAHVPFAGFQFNAGAG